MGRRRSHPTEFNSTQQIHKGRRIPVCPNIKYFLLHSYQCEATRVKNKPVHVPTTQTPERARSSFRSLFAVFDTEWRILVIWLLRGEWKKCVTFIHTFLRYTHGPLTICSPHLEATWDVPTTPPCSYICDWFVSVSNCNLLLQNDDSEDFGKSWQCTIIWNINGVLFYSGWDYCINEPSPIDCHYLPLSYV